MTRLSPVTVAMRTLRGEQLPPRCRITREQARDYLVTLSGHDFGFDAGMWTAWSRVLPERDGQEHVGILVSRDTNGEILIGLEGGRTCRAIIPRTVFRRIGFVKSGVRLRVLLRPLGCSQIVGLAESSVPEREGGHD